MPLSVDDVDLAALVLARNDTHPDGDWWFDPGTGECLYLGVDDDEDAAALAGGPHVLVPREPQPASDVDGFFSSPEAADLDDELLARLADACRGRGGVRRFRGLVARTGAGAAWSGYTLRRESVRAIDWLLERGLVDEASARRRRAELAAVDAGRGG